MNVNTAKLESVALQAYTNVPHAVVHELMRQLLEQITQELQQQGHTLTGNLISTARFEVEQLGNTLLGSVWMDDYAIYINDGIPASRIPYRRGSGAGHSKYIEGLIRFWKLRGLADKQATQAAFATAQKHKQEGMPTRSSYAFSTNGRRTGFLDQPRQEDTTIVQGVVQSLGIAVRSLINRIFKQ